MSNGWYTNGWRFRRWSTNLWKWPVARGISTVLKHYLILEIRV
jgi:hypothetical protein